MIINQRQHNRVCFNRQLLRIDVDSAEPYTIPPDNPFVDDPDVLDEIWALGVRNPWGIDFNPANGDLYIADVGDLTSEELNFQPGTAAGGANYGWPCYEGYEPHDATACAPDAELTAPIYAYGHADGRCAITGGYVYHGQSFPAWFGAYLSPISAQATCSLSSAAAASGK